MIKWILHISDSDLQLTLPPQLKIWRRTIKLCMVKKYAFRLEHIKSLSIIGVNYYLNLYRIVASYLLESEKIKKSFYTKIPSQGCWVDPIKNWMHTALCSYIKKLYNVINILLINVLNMLHLQVCVTILKKISKFPKWSCLFNCCSECSVFLFRIKKLIIKNIWNFNLLVFITRKVFAFFLCKMISYLIMVKYIPRKRIQKTSRK